MNVCDIFVIQLRCSETDFTDCRLWTDYVHIHDSVNIRDNSTMLACLLMSIANDGLSLVYAVDSEQPLSGRITCGVKSWQTTFKLVNWAVIYNVRHGLSVATDAQWIVSITPLVETGCTLPSACSETL